MNTATSTPAKRTKYILSQSCCIISTLLLVLFVFAHASRADLLMMATIFPVALWAGVALFVTVFIFSFPRMRIGLAIGWLAAVFVLGDIPQDFYRIVVPTNPHWTQARDNGKAIRVISLNCLSKIASVEELTDLQPDIILAQESPSSSALQTLIDSNRIAYTVVWSADAAMLVRGSAAAYPVPDTLTSEYVLAAVKLKNGAKFNIGSTRLIPSPVRLDVWNPAAWRVYANNRRKRYQQLSDIFRQISPHLDGRPMIFGGDFNAPARDAIFQILKPDLRDTWPEAGRGWGKTIVNNVPVHRIDQIWISPQFRAESVTAKRSSHSDHRMVICDLWLEQDGERKD